MPLRNTHVGEAKVQLYSDITFAPDEVSGQLHAQAALCPVKEPPHSSLNQMLGGPCNLAGCLGGEKNFLPIRNQTPDWPAHILVSILIMLLWILPAEYGKAVFEC